MTPDRYICRECGEPCEAERLYGRDVSDCCQGEASPDPAGIHAWVREQVEAFLKQVDRTLDLYNITPDLVETDEENGQLFATVRMIVEWPVR